MPKTGIEPIFKSYKEFVLPIKLFRPTLFNIKLCLKPQGTLCCGDEDSGLAYK